MPPSFEPTSQMARSMAQRIIAVRVHSRLWRRRPAALACNNNNLLCTDFASLGNTHTPLLLSTQLFRTALRSPRCETKPSVRVHVARYYFSSSSSQQKQSGKGALSVTTDGVTKDYDDDDDDVANHGSPVKESEFVKWERISHEIINTPLGNLSSFNAKLARQALYGFSHNRTPAAIHQAFRLIDRIAMELQRNEELKSDWYRGKSPIGLRLLNAVLDAYTFCWIQQNQTSRRSQQQEQQVETVHVPGDIFTVLQGLETLGYPTDCRSYSLLMKAAVRARGPTSSCAPPPVLCEQIIDHMLDRVATMNDSACSPDIIALTTALKAWAVSPRDDAAHRATMLWRQIIQLYDDRVLDAQPNTVFYNTVIETLVKPKNRHVGNDWEFMELAEDIMRSMRVSPYPDVAPTDVTFRLVVFGWMDVAKSLSRRREKVSREPREALLRGYKLLREILRMPSSTEFVNSSFASSLLWTGVQTSSTSNDYAVAEQIFMELFNPSAPLFEPDCSCFRAMIVLYNQTGRPDNAQEMLDALESLSKATGNTEELPKMSIYRDSIRAWVDSGHPKSVEHAEKLLKRLLELTEENGNKAYAPDRQTVSLVLEALSKSRANDSAQRAMEVFQMLQQTFERTNLASLAPRASFYLYVMQALSRSNKRDAAAQAEALLSELEDMYFKRLEPNIMPTRFHYHAVLETLGKFPKSSSVDHARSIFQRASHVFEQSGDDRVCPDEAMYGSFISVCVKAGDGKAALSMYQEMIRAFQNGSPRAMPSVRVLRNVLFACFKTKDPKAIELAYSAIASADESGCGRPDKNCLRILREIEASKGGQRVVSTRKVKRESVR